MIKGIGVDIVNIHRMEQAVERWGSRFLERIFTSVFLLQLRSNAVGNEPDRHNAWRLASPPKRLSPRLWG